MLLSNNQIIQLVLLHTYYPEFVSEDELRETLEAQVRLQRIYQPVVQDNWITRFFRAIGQVLSAAIFYLIEVVIRKLLPHLPAVFA